MNLKPRSDRGFTLLELLAVVAILALLAGLLGTSLGGRVRLKQAEEIVLHTDQWIRQVAEQRGESHHLRIQLNDNALWMQTVEDKKGSIERRFDFPAGVKIARAKTVREDRTTGEVVVDFTGHGNSLTYAIEIESDRNESRWIVFAGGTGQPLLFSESSQASQDSSTMTFRETDVENLFRTLRKKGLHTD